MRRRLGPGGTAQVAVVATVLVLLLIAPHDVSAETTTTTIPTSTTLYRNLDAAFPPNTDASDIAPTSDGGYVALGVTGDPAGYPVGWVLRLNAGGTVLWSEEIGGHYTYPTAIEQTADGGYIVAGGTQGGSGVVCDPLDGMECAWIVKLDPVGGVEWQRVYAREIHSLTVPWDLRQTPDGGYVVVGNVGYQTEYGAWIMKLDPSGAVEWQKVFGGTSYDDNAVFESVELTAEGGYVAAGWGTVGYDDLGLSQHSALVVKFDPSGGVVWQRQFSNFDATGKNLGGARAVSVVRASDGGYVVGGSWYYREAQPGGADLLLLKLDDDGNVVWEKGYDAGVVCYWSWLGYYTCVRLGAVLYSLRAHPDGGYLLSGAGWAVLGDPPELVALEAWLGKVDATGTFLWHHTYFPTYAPTGLPLASNAFYDVGVTGDGGIVAIGTTAVYETGENHFYVVKADADGNVAGCSEVYAGRPMITRDPALVENEVSLPVSSAIASVSTASGSVLATTADSSRNCGALLEPAPRPPRPRPPRQKIKD